MGMLQSKSERRAQDIPVTNLKGMVTRSSSSDILAVFTRGMKAGVAGVYVSWICVRSCD